MYLMDEIKELDRTLRWNPTFQMLQLDTRKMVDDLTQTVAKLPQNRALNRYRDVLPYDATRVRLKTAKNDYINASYVEVPRVKRRYILAQGPLPSTSEDFWRMIWENNSKGIIMLNKIVEKNVIKCHPYWPMGEEEELEFGEFVISNYSCQMKSSFIIRELLLLNSVTDESRIIKQFHFVTWPDFGVPMEPGSFLEFLDEIKATDILDSEDAPAVVHCSAGIGRSGTFCLVDSALELAILNNSIDDINPHKMLLSMRTYRCGLVQTAEQLRFANIAIVYGLYSIFPSIAENDDDESDDGSNDEDCIPPPLPPRKKKDIVPPIKPARTTTEEQKDQEEAYRELIELDDSSSEGSSDEEILDLSNDSSEDIENMIEEEGIEDSIPSYTKIQEKIHSDVQDDIDNELIMPRTEQTYEEDNLDGRNNEAEIRQRHIQEKKRNTKELVDKIKKNMKENENRVLPKNFWKYTGIVVGVVSLLSLAYHLYNL